MKRLVILLLTLPSIGSAECSNFIAKSEIAKALALQPNAGAVACSGSEDCVCFDHVKDWSVMTWGDVDDLNSPKYVASQIVACAGKDECAAKLQEQKCDQGVIAYIDADFKTVYCAVPNGYNTKKALIVDAAKKAAKDAAQAKIQAIEDLISAGQKKQNVGQRMIAAIVAKNDKKGLTKAQRKQLTQNLQPIIALLQVGSIDAAKEEIQKLVPDGTLILQSDIDLASEYLTSQGF